MEPPLFQMPALGAELEKAKKTLNLLGPRGSKSLTTPAPLQTSAIQALVQQKQVAPAVQVSGCPTIVLKGNTS